MLRVPLGYHHDTSLHRRLTLLGTSIGMVWRDYNHEQTPVQTLQCTGMKQRILNGAGPVAETNMPLDVVTVPCSSRKIVSHRCRLCSS